MIDGPEANVFTLYLAKALQGSISINLSILNAIYSLINSFFPEWIIVFIIPYLMMIICTVIIVINGIYLSVMWFYNMRYFISVHTTDANGKTVWEKGNLFTIMNLCIIFFVITLKIYFQNALYVLSDSYWVLIKPILSIFL